MNSAGVQFTDREGENLAPNREDNPGGFVAHWRTARRKRAESGACKDSLAAA